MKRFIGPLLLVVLIAGVAAGIFFSVRSQLAVRNVVTVRDLLDQEMKSIAQEFYRNTTEQLVAHGRFLEEKFERSESLFGIGSG